MNTFYITVRTTTRAYPTYTAIAATAGQAGEDAADLFDEPCGITVISTAVR